MCLLFPRNVLVLKDVLTKVEISSKIFQRSNFISTNHQRILTKHYSIYSEIISALHNLNNGIKTLLDSLYITFAKVKIYKGKTTPSKWRWYHRHGYWATRKKLLKFDTYRRHRYHEVRGPGKKAPNQWEDKSYYKPLKEAVKFW